MVDVTFAGSLLSSGMKLSDDVPTQCDRRDQAADWNPLVLHHGLHSSPILEPANSVSGQSCARLFRIACRYPRRCRRKSPSRVGSEVRVRQALRAKSTGCRRVRNQVGHPSADNHDAMHQRGLILGYRSLIIDSLLIERIVIVHFVRGCSLARPANLGARTKSRIDNQESTTNHQSRIPDQKVESHLTRRLFGSMPQRIWALPVPTG